MKRIAGEAGGHAVGDKVASLFESVTRLGLRASTLPFKLLPKGIATEPARRLARTSALFPRALSRALLEYADELEGLMGDLPPAADAESDLPSYTTFRDLGQEAAIIFVHGFGQNSAKTWGEFPNILLGDPLLQSWDVYSIGYSTNLWLDFSGLWTASPPISRLGSFFGTITDHSPFAKYRSLAVIAHSMGGLVTQRALLDLPELRARISHLILFGTPSGGLAKASLMSFYKRQIRDMAQGSPFITDLRQRWRELIGKNPPFEFLAVAGDEDEFVAAESVLDSFPEDFQAVVPGDHLSIVNPRSAKQLSVELVKKQLIGEAAPAGPWNSARLAVEGRRFRDAIDSLWPHRDELDDATRVTLALALESDGRSDDAIAVLKSASGTDPMGALAGRLKRRWLKERRQDDGARALQLYSQALAAAEAAKDREQAYYHAINVAFLQLAFLRQPPAAEEHAQRALEHCAAAPEGLWRWATEGEAWLVLGAGERALEGYRRAVECRPQPRQMASMFHQAVSVADLRSEDAVIRRLRQLFRAADTASG